jgi:hypothetical protein
MAALAYPRRDDRAARSGCRLIWSAVDGPKYVSRVRIIRERGPIRTAHIPAETEPIVFGTHDEVREHYGTAAGEYPEHATTLDYVVAATAG